MRSGQSAVVPCFPKLMSPLNVCSKLNWPCPNSCATVAAGSDPASEFAFRNTKPQDVALGISPSRPPASPVLPLELLRIKMYFLLPDIEAVLLYPLISAAGSPVSELLRNELPVMVSVPSLSASQETSV